MRHPTPKVFVVCYLLLLVAGVHAAAADTPDSQPETKAALQWFRGNLHTHSLWSDGNDFPEMIAAWYREAGYHFLALSDHNILSEGEKWMPLAEAEKRGSVRGLERYRKRFGNDWVETRGQDAKLEVRLKPLNEFRALVEERGRFLLIQAEEITDHFEKLPVHVNATNLRDAIQPQGGRSVRETIANNLEAVERQSKRVGQPMLAHVNHPNYGFGVSAEDLASVTAERFFEVYNGGVNNIGDKDHPSTDQIWDIANTIRLEVLHAAPLMGLATDDSHHYFLHNRAETGRGWVCVRAPFLTPESIVHAIKRGDFYASTGVELNDITYSPESRELRLAIAAQEGAEYTTNFVGTVQAEDPPLPNKPAGAEPAAARDPAAPQSAVPQNGAPPVKTQKPDPRIGKVLATVGGLTPSYVLTGKELYVRAVVNSNRPPTNPSYDGQRQQAWTQPVGWDAKAENGGAGRGQTTTALDK